MTAQEVKTLCEETKAKLKQAIDALEAFLNEHSISKLNGEQDSSMDEFYRGFLSDLRHLLVFSEVDYEKLGTCLRRPNFNSDYAEKVLYNVYHQCVNSFFYPKSEGYSEDGRYAYTGQDAIRFRKKPVREVRDIILGLSKIYEQIREDLAYYETEYVNQRRMQGEKI